jgi:hypothetical protein
MTQDHSAEIENPDTEVEDCADEIVGTLEAAFDLLIERREAALAAAIKPLDTEEQSLRQEYGSIGSAARTLELLLPARKREAEREADRLLLDGKPEEARAKIAESEEARTAPEAMKGRQREISARIEAIAGERQAIARRVFETWYGELQHVIRAAERGLFIELLDKSRDEMFAFQTRTNTTSPNGLTGGLFHSGHVVGLTADDRSPEWVSSQRWYASRTR